MHDSCQASNPLMARIGNDRSVRRALRVVLDEWPQLAIGLRDKHLSDRTRPVTRLMSASASSPSQPEGAGRRVVYVRHCSLSPDVPIVFAYARAVVPMARCAYR